ncbi:MAG: hypothetical protein KatS3mg027_1398 [Bacteroidia bacterium]|nr:MAG: hypothetical protein KatS3mg027_1398 [Bacteroidia bacterium]
MKKSLIVHSLVIFTLSCTTLKLAEPTEIDVEKGKDIFPNLTLEELKEGKKLYQNNCNLCHKLYNPKALNEAEWRKIIPPMVKKVNKKLGQQILSSQDEEKILKYVLVIQQR